MSENIRKWSQYAVLMLVFLFTTYQFVTGKTNVPPAPPPVVPMVVAPAAPPCCPCLQSPDGGSMMAKSEEFKFGSPAIRKALCKRLIESAIKRGANPVTAAEVVSNLDMSSPLLDWLFNGGFARLLELVMELIALYKAPMP